MRYWLPAVIWSAVILLMSGSAGSAAESFRILEWIISPTNRWFEVVHVLTRKFAHLLAYGLLGALDFRAVRGPRPGWTLRWSLSAVALAMLIAALDEWHQTIVPARTGMASDVMVDAAGAMIVQLVYRLRAR